jgi:hypothetical protein
MVIRADMSAGERRIGWCLFLTGAGALVCVYYVESFRASQILVAIFAVSGYALSALLTYDLFHRVDLPIRRKTLLTVIMWIIPCANWFVFIKYRNLPCPVLG